jgi:AraC family transcriptional regulator, transcriptional activator of pobA
MHIHQTHKIPSLDLIHNNEKVSFVFRTMEEIHVRLGNTPDIPHRHDYYTILWAKKVCGIHYIDYKEFPIKPNYIFFVNPGQVHQVVTFGDPEGVVIMFTREFLHQNQIPEEFLFNLGLFSDTAITPPLIIQKSASVKIHAVIDELQEIFDQAPPFRAELLGAYLKVFLIECNKHLPPKDDLNTQTLESGRQILKEFKSLVEKQFVTWHKVNKYADSLSISPDYLNSIIKTTIGKTAKEFIQERINLEAKRLGVHTQLSLKEIAFQLGFDDPSHFSKFFKNVEGASFSEFRANLEKALPNN